MMAKTDTKHKSGLWAPSLFIYDAGACTKEEHDPAKAVLYHRPRNVSIDTRTAITGQLAGVAHFCRSVFSSPTYLKTKYAHISMKHYGRFILMICGKSRKWSESRMASVSRLIDSSTGGIPSFWMSFSDKEMFNQRLTSLLDAIVLQTMPDINFEDGSSGSGSSFSSSSSYSPSSELLEEVSPEKPIQEQSLGGALWRRMTSQTSDPTPPVPAKTKAKSQPREITPRVAEEIVMANLHRELSAIPYVTLPKSGASSFLRAEQLMRSCQQYKGVLAGSTSFKNRVINSHVDLETQHVLSSLSNIEKENNGVLDIRKTEFQLPNDVTLYNLYLSQKSLKHIIKSIPKLSQHKGERKGGVHNETRQAELASLRSALHNQSLHSNSPLSIPPMANKTKPYEDDTRVSGLSKDCPMDQLLLCSKISKNVDFLSDCTTSKSLPGSPRQIRVATMLPDVGNDSPGLRYKVLTARRPKPGTSTNNTPRRVPGGLRNANVGKGSNLAAPSLKRKEFLKKADHNFSINSGNGNSRCHLDKENNISINSNELNIKNTKNKLNLHFAPGKVYRPSGDFGEEEKISREINGSYSKEILAKEFSRKLLKSQLVDLNDEDEESKSDGSEISILELNSFAESKEKGNLLFEQATNLDTPFLERPLSNEDEGFVSYTGQASNPSVSVSSMTNIADHHWTKFTLYVQDKANMTLQLILDNDSATDQLLVYNLCKLARISLTEIEKSLVKTFEIAEEKEGDTFLQISSSAISGVDSASLHSASVEAAHDCFFRHSSLTEITFKEKEIVLWSHKNNKSETFYQSTGVSRAGLPIPSDAMARIPHRARKRLERDHSIMLL